MSPPGGVHDPGDDRPDPDALLARVAAAEERARRGRLKVYLGAAAGVGKTYAMLDAAQRQRAAGLDVVVGWVETHGRAETEALLAGLEVLPPRRVAYRGRELLELDVDAALARRPALLLVDELAHTNAPGSRHPKRWDDVLELLDAGIDVDTTVNVQHLESSNDIVARVTGIAVRETVPDAVLDRADQVELVDLPPDDLLARLAEGKVYVPEQAAAAARSFFRKGNLLALRELALRRVVERVDAQLEDYRAEHAIAEPWPAGERLLVCVGPGPLATRLVRSARRMAAALRAPWHVLNVETPAQRALPATERDRVVETLRLAEQLGAQTATLSGQRVADEVLRYARRCNATKIVIGKPIHARWRDLAFGSVLDEVVRGSGAIDVYVISGEPDEPAAPGPAMLAARRPGHLLAATAVVAACTALASLVWPWLGRTNVVMIFMAGVAFVASRYGRSAAILASVLSVLSFDYFFVPPYLTFDVADAIYLVTFAVMLAVALLISSLAVGLRHAAESAREGERRAAALHALSRDLASTRGIAPLMATAVRHAGDVFGARAVALLPDDGGQLAARAGEPPELEVAEAAVARWVFEHGRPAGAGTGTLPGAHGTYVPLRAPRGIVGVLGVRRPESPQAIPPGALHLLETFANHTALAVERAHLADEAERARVQIETERLRSALLRAISHDLRTPLAAIAGASSALLDGDASLDAETRRELAHAIHDEAARLSRLIADLLEMTRLESGALELDLAWQPLEEVIGAALRRLDTVLGDREVTLDVPADLPLVPFDAVLIERVLVNLVENAIAHGPPGGPIEVAVRAGEEAILGVADRGPGIDPEDAPHVFEPFYRGRGARARGAGTGLGLAICHGIVAAHGGRIWAEAREGGGTVMRVALPLAGPGGPPSPALPAIAEEPVEPPAPADG